ncbi:MAG: hypothetical protein KGJ19_07330 [Betaproteobacteria bacterium]|nr:hypothetical protein [Betaproteobacteria bacterium]MDE2309220.1 hypothetical protein [Betaproteobacteria bacterium]
MSDEELLVIATGDTYLSWRCQANGIACFIMEMYKYASFTTFQFFILGGIMKKLAISLLMMMSLAVFAEAFACDIHPDETSTSPSSPTPDSSSTAK